MARNNDEGSSEAAGGPDLGSSRAVLREVRAGCMLNCLRCGERIRFNTRTQPKQVICNVYSGGDWQRVEHYHDYCYDEAGEPHGPVDRERTSWPKERLTFTKPDSAAS